MITLQDKIKDLITKNNLQRYLDICNFGLEKENVRVNLNGELALTKHPKEFGNKGNNPYITTDFSESQVEMVTPPCDTIDSVYNFMGALNDIVSTTLRDEVLWPQSNPPILPEEEKIPIADFNGGIEEEYRKKLAEKYGKKKQLISGVHFNFSFKNDFLKMLYEEVNHENQTYVDFKNSIYLNISRNFFKFRWLLVYLTGASPIFHKSYIETCVNKANSLNNETFYFENTYSLRNSDCGYKNINDFFVSYDSIEMYANDIQNAIDKNYISSEKEYYSPIRLKSSSGNGSIKSLKNDGIEYVEIRILDLDPLSEFGVSKDTLELLHIFLIHMTLTSNLVMTNKDYNESNYNDELIKSYGRKKDIKVYDCEKEVSLTRRGVCILNRVTDTLESLDMLTENRRRILETAKERVLDCNKTLASQIVNKIKETSYIDFHMQVALNGLELSEKSTFSLRGFENMELSTQILLRDAIKRGIKIEVLDKLENFISLKKNEKIEFVKQATKTSKDTYITALLMENKEVTKKILQANNIKVPKGEVFENIELAKDSYSIFKNKEIVIKPKSTNFGLGISIFKNIFSKEDFEKAIEIAFNEDRSILIEEFIKGREFRFLVINDKVVGILHRVPANIKGDGISTITQLVEEKNKDFLRGKGYVKPLEKIKLGPIEEMFLKSQNLRFDSILEKDQLVYLRENSNISTGGDSLDFTDDIHPSYNEIAVEAAKAAKARITGIDIMIQDINEMANDKNHAIIEMNFNPAIHIHCFPYKGKNRLAGEKVLDLLFE
ncbi:MAG: bifunctional glutamate--cysteine ligase GshA/glutathione synthetase GshB [Sarcina sp.]